MSDETKEVSEKGNNERLITSVETKAMRLSKQASIINNRIIEQKNNVLCVVSNR